MPSDFRNYGWNDLESADHIDLAAALTTIYAEGKGSLPDNRHWNAWNTYSLGYIPGRSSFITIHAFEGSHTPENIFYLNTTRQDVSWKEGNRVVSVTPVPEHLQPFLKELTGIVHDIETKREAERTDVGILKRKREGEEREQKRMKEKEMEGAGQAQAERSLKDKLECRKAEVGNIARVINWKASAAELFASLLHENPSDVQKMLESAKQDPTHDLCVACGETLRFCEHEGCTIIGCVKCFGNELTMCTYCDTVVCEKHGNDFNGCYTCEDPVCRSCDDPGYRRTCTLCDEFICSYCSKCRGCGISLNDDECPCEDDSYGDEL